MKVQTYDLNTNTTEISLTQTIRDLLERRNYENVPIEYTKETPQTFDFVKITSITYDREKKETDIQLIDFQQLLSAVSSFNGKFAYVIESDENGISLYLGGEQQFLKDNFEGIYGGSETEFINVNLENMPYTKAMLGVPSLKKDSNKEFKQNLEKIISPLQGKKFRIVLVAESFKLDDVNLIIDNYRKLKDEIHKFTKVTKTINETNSKSKGISFTISETNSTTSSYSDSISDKTKGSKAGSIFTTIAGGIIGGLVGGPAGIAIGASLGGMVGMNFFSKTKTTSNSYSKSFSTATSKTTSSSTTTAKSFGISFEEINTNAKYIEDLIDQYIKRYQKGITNGMWRYALYIQAEDDYTLNSLATTIRSVYSGENSFFEPIRFSPKIDIDINKLPFIEFEGEHIIHNSFASLTTNINTEELSILSALPSKDLPGIKVGKVSSYGTNINSSEGIAIGNLLDKKRILPTKFKLSKEIINSHIFVSGITGSGKTNTIKQIITQTYKKYKIPFLIIEPAKSEYKNLIEDIPELQIFRLGERDDVFRLNPFMFDVSNPTITLFKHIDMLKTAFNAAFPMYASMPYLLEEAIYEIYKDRGWVDGKNPYVNSLKSADKFRQAFMFPTMKELKNKVEEVVKSSGYYTDLESNLKAALSTRINNLLVGTKGNIFNTRFSIDDEVLFSKPTVIELSNIPNDEEKTFIMALILNKLYFYMQQFEGENELKHITVIEEAHRLLPNIKFDNNFEQNNTKAYSVEVFTNMLAEIRAYGEGLIIVDQIATKLHPDVIKNTNTKIIQRTMATDDREAVGKSINLTKNQILDIADLKTGEAIIHNKELLNPVMVKVNEYPNINITNEKIQNFYTKFLKQYPYLKYKFPLNYETTSQCDIFKITEYDKINYLKFITLVFSGFNYVAFFEELKNRFKDCTIEVLLELWEELKVVNKVSIFENINEAYKAYRDYLLFILALYEGEEIEIERKRFIQNFHYKNINIYPKKDKICFVPIILENIKYYNLKSIDETVIKNLFGESEFIDEILEDIDNLRSFNA
jgi:DNA helicase HerA-like ATPase